MNYLEALNGSTLFDAAAKFASILGFAFTAYAVYRIAEIRRTFLQKARLPALQADLRQRVEELNDGLREFDESKRLILDVLSRCASTLRSVSRIARGKTRSLAKKAERSIKRYRRDQLEENAREIYVELRELEEDLKYLRSDIIWS